MTHEEYIKAIAPFEDFKSRANNCSDNKFKSKLMEAYDKEKHDYIHAVLNNNSIN